MSPDALFAAPPEHHMRFSEYGKRMGTEPEVEGILELCRALNVRFLRLTFTDILGHTKNVEVPASQFRKALEGEIMFDGSSIEGFVRIEESDMLLKPDLRTFRVFPWGNPDSRVARRLPSSGGKSKAYMQQWALRRSRYFAAMAASSILGRWRRQYVIMSVNATQQDAAGTDCGIDLSSRPVL